jgi:hypothetical protein
MYWASNGATLLVDTPDNTLPHPPGSIGAKAIAPCMVESRGCFHQTNVPMLDKIAEAQPSTAVTFGNADDQPDVAFNHFILGFADSGCNLLRLNVESSTVFTVRDRGLS